MFVPHSLPFIGNSEVQVIVAHVSDYFRYSFKPIGHTMFPLRRIKRNVTDVALGRPHARANGTKEHISCGADKAKTLDHGRNRRLTCFSIGLNRLSQTFNDALFLPE